MYPATRIAPAVPFIGRLTYLGAAYSSGTTLTVPAATKTGDIVFCYTAGFDAGNSTNPGGVGYPSNPFFQGEISPNVPEGRYILTSAQDPSGGSDDGVGVFAWQNNLTGGIATQSYFTGASGDNNNIFSFGLRDINGNSTNKSLKVILHSSVSDTRNITNFSVAELGFPSYVYNARGYYEWKRMMEHVIQPNQLGLLIVVIGQTDGSTPAIALSDFPYGSSTQSPAGNPAGPDVTTYRGTLDNFDGTFTTNSGATIFAYQVAYPGEKFRPYVYAASGSNTDFPVISRMILEVS
jgi:hypothetical protein